MSNALTSRFAVIATVALGVALAACTPNNAGDDDTPPISHIVHDEADHGPLALPQPGTPAQQRTCATDDVLAAQLASDPDMASRMQDIEAHTARYQGSLPATSGTTTIIPVVVHVLYKNATENISDAQIQSQIDVLNADFRRTNSDADNTWPQAADTDIEFCLTGISRTATSTTSFGTNDSIKFYASGGHDVYLPDQSMNMWVGDIGGGILGYAQFPGGSPATDGVVVDYRYFGTIGTATAPFDLGRTATHEVGHWLNLRHIWGDGGCTVDDFVADTPTSDASNFGCATSHVSCTTVDMVQNYMDYSDDACMNLFTAGQKTRMEALFGAGGAREGLVNALCDNIEIACTDGLDNDGDGATDCADAECTGDPACAPPPTCGTDSAVNFSLVFDDYPAETSWDITDSVGGIVDSGGGYTAASPDVNLDLTLADGDYTLTIYDSYGDGICCGYGLGAYTLTSGADMLASGGAFGSVDTTPFCIDTSGGPPAIEVCDDNVDNDGDGATDCDDSDCDILLSCWFANN